MRSISGAQLPATGIGEQNGVVSGSELNRNRQGSLGRQPPELGNENVSGSLSVTTSVARRMESPLI